MSGRQAAASFDNYKEHPIAFLVPLVVVASVALMRLTMGCAFEAPVLSSFCGYLASMMIGAATGLFPVLLPTVGTRAKTSLSPAPSRALTRYVLVWPGGLLVGAWVNSFAIVYWLLRGKVPTDAEGYGHQKARGGGPVFALGRLVSLV